MIGTAPILLSLGPCPRNEGKMFGDDSPTSSPDQPYMGRGGSQAGVGLGRDSLGVGGCREAPRKDMDRGQEGIGRGEDVPGSGYLSFLLDALCSSLQRRHTAVTLLTSAFVLFFCCSCHPDGFGHGFNLPRRERACFHVCAK